MLKARVTTMAIRNPKNSAATPVRIRLRSLVLMPSATLMIAEYSGPTTMAPTIRIWEFVKMPMAAISPAIVSRMNQLGG
jgi:hypothetical protein